MQQATKETTVAKSNLNKRAATAVVGQRFSLFAPIVKVDEAQRLVFGRITQEVVDYADEILDYEKSKPYFEAWSAKIAKDSGGASLGNVRVMHQPKVGGVLKEIIFNDDEKAIDCVAKIIDDGEWLKVLEGGYTGFSMGGHYVSTEADPVNEGVVRFVADPVEVSIVDSPCVPTAVFSMIKANGATETMKFKPWQPTDLDVVAEAVALATTDGARTRWPEFVKAAHSSLAMKRAAGIDANAAAEPAEGESEDELGLKQVWQTPDGKSFGKKQAARAHVLAKLDPVERAIARSRAVIAGEQALDFPIDTALNVRASFAKLHSKALVALRDPAELEAAKARVASAWKGMIDADGPPVAVDKWALPGLSRALKKIASCKSVKPLAKGLWTVAEVAAAMEQFGWLQSGITWEEESEAGADSTLPVLGAAVMQAMGVLLVAMAQEEVAELMAIITQQLPNVSLEAEVAEPAPAGAGDDAAAANDAAIVEQARAILGLAKADAALIAKVGARHNKADAETIQQLHDSTSALGAKCNKIEGDEEFADDDTEGEGEGDDEVEEADDAGADGKDGDTADDADASVDEQAKADAEADADDADKPEDDDTAKAKKAKLRVKKYRAKHRKHAHGKARPAKLVIKELRAAQKKTQAQLTKAVAALDEATTAIAALKAATPGAAAPRTHVVSKTEDTRPSTIAEASSDPEIAKMIDKLSPQERALLAIKLQQAAPPKPMQQRG